MITLAVCNHKGGTGKTTSTIHIGAALGLSGFRTLVIDLDPQGFLTRMLGASEPPPEASCLALFNHNVDFSALPVLRFKAFDLLPSTSVLSKVMRKLNRPTDVLWIKEALQRIDSGYDAILFDTAAAITVYSLNALVASSYVLIPVMPEYQPVLGAEQTYQTALMVREKLNPDLHLPLIIFTMVDGRKRNHHAYRRYLRKQYGDQVMESIIRTSTSLSVTNRDGTTVFDREPHSRGARDYANATDELVRLINPTGASNPTEEASPDAREEPWKSISSFKS